VVFSGHTPVPSINKTYCHDITEILLKAALNTITLSPDHIPSSKKDNPSSKIENEQ
jgi:hypothetical protein